MAYTRYHEFDSLTFSLTTDDRNIREEIGMMFPGLRRAEHNMSRGVIEWRIERAGPEEGHAIAGDRTAVPEYVLYRNRRRIGRGGAREILEAAEWDATLAILRRSKRYLQIHSAVVAHRSRAHLLIGPPGSGKSTLALALLLSGLRVLSDEVALLAPSEQGARMGDAGGRSGDDTAEHRREASSPETKSVHSGAAEGFRVRSFPRCFHVDERTIATLEHMFGRLSAARHACGVFKDASGKARLDPSKLKRHWTVERATAYSLVFLDPDMPVKNRILPLPKTDALVRLAEQTINLQDYGPRAVERLVSLVDTIPCYRFNGLGIERSLQTLYNFFTLFV